MPDHSSKLTSSEAGRVRQVTYWRIEGSLLEISALRSLGFFNWNSQSFLERWVRRAAMLANGTDWTTPESVSLPVIVVDPDWMTNCAVKVATSPAAPSPDGPGFEVLPVVGG